MRSVFDPDLQNSSIEARIVVALERLSEAFRTRLWNENKKHNLSPLQIRFLIFILFHPDKKIGVKKLSEEFHITKPTASDAVKVLIRKKYLKESDDPEDGRRKLLVLTNKGERIANQISFFANSIREEIDPLEMSQKEVMLQSLLDIIYRLQQAGIISVDRMCYRCRYFMRSNDPGQPHYCRLLEEPLQTADLRIDCQEFEPV
jgi:DNA-binding MarR family transcriptional regulator